MLRNQSDSSVEPVREPGVPLWTSEPNCQGEFQTGPDQETGAPFVRADRCTKKWIVRYQFIQIIVDRTVKQCGCRLMKHRDEMQPRQNEAMSRRGCCHVGLELCELQDCQPAQ